MASPINLSRAVAAIPPGSTADPFTGGQREALETLTVRPGLKARLQEDPTLVPALRRALDNADFRTALGRQASELERLLARVEGAAHGQAKRRWTDPPASEIPPAADSEFVADYPELADSLSSRFIGEGLKLPALEEVMRTLDSIDLSSTTARQDFESAVLRIHALLTGDGTASIKGGNISVDQRAVKSFGATIERVMGQVMSAARRKPRVSSTVEDLMARYPDFNFSDDEVCRRVVLEKS